MQDVSVAVAEEDQSIALIDKGFAKKVNPTITKLGVGRVEIVNIDRQMTDARILHLLRRSRTFGWNNFKHGPISRPHKIVAIVCVVDSKV